MKYKLRGDLNKTTVYMVVKQFAPLGITLPSLRKCDFIKYRGSYWLVFDFCGHRFRAFFSTCVGSVMVSYEMVSWDMDSQVASEYEGFTRQVVTLTPDYLLGNGLLREVA